MSSKILTMVIMMLMGLGVITLSVPVVHASTIVPVATAVSSTFTTSAVDLLLTFTVKNSGDILVVSASDINNGPCASHHPTVSDGLNTWTMRIQAEQTSAADADVWTATAGASGSLTITVHYAACSSHGAGATAYDLVGYTLTGLQVSSGTGASGTIMSVTSLAVAVPSIIIGASAARGSVALPVTTTDALFVTEYQDPNSAADFGHNGAGYGLAFINGGYDVTSTFPITESNWGSNFAAWAEVVIALPQTSSSITTTTTVTTTINTTSYPTSIVPEQILVGLIVLIIVYGLVAKSVKGGIGGLSKEYS